MQLLVNIKICEFRNYQTDKTFFFKKNLLWMYYQINLNKQKKKKCKIILLNMRMRKYTIILIALTQ